MQRRNPRRWFLQCGLVAAAVLAGAPACLAGWQAPADWHSGFVTTPDGVRIHYYEAGPGEDAGAAAAAAPALLFVPGWTMPAQIWQPQIEHFAAGRRVVAMDPRSHGLSDQPDDGHYPEALGRDVKAVIDELGLAPVVPVCWSLAVAECVAVVDQFGTGDLAALVLVDGLAGGGPNPQFTALMVGWMGRIERDREASTDSFVRTMYRTPQSEEYLRQVVEWSLETPTDAAVALMLGGLTNDNRDALAKIDKPTLLVVTRSPYLPLYEEMRDRIPDARFEIFDTGHALFVDQPERFNTLVEELLTGRPAATAPSGDDAEPAGNDGAPDREAPEGGAR